jgi:hypothetical protein
MKHRTLSALHRKVNASEGHSNDTSLQTICSQSPHYLNKAGHFVGRMVGIFSTSLQPATYFDTQCNVTLPVVTKYRVVKDNLFQ